MLSKSFWVATLERAIKTAAQAAIAAIGTSAVGLLDVSWPGVAAAAGLMAVLSILTSIGSAAHTHGGPSLAGETLTTEVDEGIASD
jgi:hypothetical protein